MNGIYMGVDIFAHGANGERISMPFDEKDAVIALEYFQSLGFDTIFADLGFKGNMEQSEEIDLVSMQSILKRAKNLIAKERSLHGGNGDDDEGIDLEFGESSDILMTFLTTCIDWMKANGQRVYFVMGWWDYLGRLNQSKAIDDFFPNIDHGIIATVLEFPANLYGMWSDK